MEEPLRVISCELCRIFTNKEVKTKLYWPENIDDLPKSEFAIVDCTTCHIPMVVYGDHVDTVSREAWGRILYRSKKIFGGGITLRTKPRRIFDHFHAHIVNIEEEK
jgi:ribosomal protein S27E